MGVAEEHAPRGETIEIGGLCLRVATQAADPVVQIVDRDEQDVGLLLLARPGKRNACREEDCRGREG